MWKVDIYLETDSTFQGKRERKCGYVLVTMVKDEEKTKENFGKSNGTYHQSVLVTLAEALSRMNVSSEICVHTGWLCSKPHSEAGRNGRGRMAGWERETD